jgi:hypothetical protein
MRFLAAASVVLVLAPSASVAQIRSWKPKLEAKLSLNPSYYPDHIGQSTVQVALPVLLEPQLSLRPSRRLRFKFASHLFSDPVSASQSERLFLDADEAAAEIRLADSSIKAGLNQVSWGATDVFNPLEVVSARRFFDPLNASKRAVPSVILTQNWGDFRFEALYAPVQFKAVLPGENSRWLPRDVTYDRSSDFIRVVLPSNLRYSYVEASDLDGALKHNFGGRIEANLSGLDVSAIWFEGAPTAPAVLPVVTGTIDVTPGDEVFYADPEVGLRPVYYRRQTGGATAVVTMETAIIRMAVAASDKLVDDPAVPGWSQSAVLAFEKNFAVDSSTLTVLLQSSFARHEEQSDNTVTSLDRIFDRSVFLGLRLATDGEWAFGAATLLEGVSDGLIVQLRAEKKIADGFTAAMQADLIDAPVGAPLGTYRRNDRIGAGLSLFW